MAGLLLMVVMVLMLGGLSIVKGLILGNPVLATEPVTFGSLSMVEGGLRDLLVWLCMML